MTRLFNILAAALLTAAVVLSFVRPNAQPMPAAPEAAIVAVATRAGLVHTWSRRIGDGAELISFSQHGCTAPVYILYLPSVTHFLPVARQLAAGHAGPLQVVYDGKPVKGLSFGDIFWPWLRRKLIIAVTFAPRDKWSSVLTLVLMPLNCPRPLIDWAALSRPS
jgi:hypothetical protein